MTASCPKCKCNDRIEKLSAVRRKGTVTLDSARVGTITVKSALTEHMNPPERPGISQMWYILPIFNITMLFAPIDKQDKIKIGICLCLMAIPQIATFAMCASYAIYYGSAIKKANDRIVRAEMPAYREALAKWEACYYCHRDDLIFLPQS